MKNLILSALILGGSIFCFPIFSQNNQTYSSLGLAGDNLNLYGVLNLFQESATLEEFEQKLNIEDSKINNLDLDGDGRTDYIRVIDNINGNAHSIVLQDVINGRESQDVAVIEVGRDKYNHVLIQIIGDEQLYGRDYIIEPVNGTPNPGYTGNTNVVNNNYYNSGNNSGNKYAYRHADSWNIIRFIFAPSYVVYVSPWRWEYYPTYWHPWHQMHYNDYYSHWSKHNSYTYFHQSHSYNVPAAHSYYGPRRTSSTTVHQRTEKGDFSRTNNRTTIDSKQNTPVQTPESRKDNNNQLFKNENRKTDVERNRLSNPSNPENKLNKTIPENNNNRVVPSNNNNRTIPADRPAKNSDTKTNERKASKSSSNPEVKKRTNSEVKQNTNSDVKQDKPKEEIKRR